MTLWALVQSPLIIGADIRDGELSTFTKSLLTNSGLLSMTADIKRAHESVRHNTTNSGYIIWQATSKQRTTLQYVAVFNLLNRTAAYNVSLQVLGLSTSGKPTTWTNLWHPSKAVDVGTGAVLHVELPAHGVLAASVAAAAVRE